MGIHSAWALVFRVHCTADMLQYWFSVLVGSVAQAYGNLRPWQKLVLLVLHPPAQYMVKILSMCVGNLWPQGDFNVNDLVHICWQDITTFSGSEPCWVTLPTPAAAAASAARSCQAVCSCRLDGEYISVPTMPFGQCHEQDELNTPVCSWHCWASRCSRQACCDSNITMGQTNHEEIDRQIIGLNFSSKYFLL